MGSRWSKMKEYPNDMWSITHLKECEKEPVGELLQEKIKRPQVTAGAMLRFRDNVVGK